MVQELGAKESKHLKEEHKLDSISDALFTKFLGHLMDDLKHKVKDNLETLKNLKTKDIKNPNLIKELIQMIDEISPGVTVGEFVERVQKENREAVKAILHNAILNAEMAEWGKNQEKAMQKVVMKDTTQTKIEQKPDRLDKFIRKASGLDETEPSATFDELSPDDIYQVREDLSMSADGKFVHK